MTSCIPSDVRLEYTTSDISNPHTFSEEKVNEEGELRGAC